uniref:Protein RER1 n=1 Tax=Percolomonas cosmopolitus TaxID=63605 RepID=A0A7S1PEA5_9EUKA|eukprot:CAMPEP_0117444644 /NCGR_PEP_ID=MMETSP0759-20121206/5351_1 /TAXON_ID=63605 /ORGANISM="Percolomonas cosmopolitus, Strain WS" /LENGTH=201 /DNA_ID=CAMNT_0005236725 /DNA_START=23 /DNA_END=628 /DNA_ORIENTATION=+
MTSTPAQPPTYFTSTSNVTPPNALSMNISSSSPSFSKRLHRLQMRYQSFLDKLNGKRTGRWLFTLVLTFIFFFRVFYFQGWYIITYSLGIYVLNLFILYLTPNVDPDEDQNAMAASSATDSGSFRVFVRRLPEFKFWYYLTRALLISTLLTLFRIFDIPVFWPILLMYFIVLFVFTMRKQIMHMYKHNYLPWTVNKPTYLP